MFSMAEARRFIYQIQGVSKDKLLSMKADLDSLNELTPPQVEVLLHINEELKAIEKADKRYESR